MRRFLFISLHFIGKGFGINKKFRNLTEAVFKIYKPSSLLNHSQDHVKLFKNESHSR